MWYLHGLLGARQGLGEQLSGLRSALVSPSDVLGARQQAVLAGLLRQRRCTERAVLLRGVGLVAGRGWQVQQAVLTGVH